MLSSGAALRRHSENSFSLSVFWVFMGFRGNKGKPMPMILDCFHGVFRNQAFPMPIFQLFFMGFLVF